MKVLLFKRILIVSILLFGVLYKFGLYAQSVNDFQATVIPKNGICLRDCSLDIQAKQVVGAPTNYKYSLEYNVQNSRGEWLFSEAESTPEHFFGNLAAGTYSPVLFINIKGDNGEITETLQKPLPQVVVKTSYKQPAVILNQVRKSLRNYKENGQTVYTGILTITITQGNGPYKIILKQTPPEYKHPESVTLKTNGTYTLYNVEPGNYVFSIQDACGGLGDYPIEMNYVTSNYKQSGHAASYIKGMPLMPFDWLEVTDRTIDMIQNHCGWFRAYAPYLYSGGMGEEELSRYRQPLDTLYKYYQFGTQTPSETKAGLPIKFHTPENAPLWSDVNYVAVEPVDNYNNIQYIYARIPDDKSFQGALNGGDMEYWPLFYFQVKGDTEHSHGLVISPAQRLTNYDYKIRQENVCDDYYYLDVRASKNKQSLYCLPLHFRLVDEDDAGFTTQLDLNNLTDEFTPVPAKLLVGHVYDVYTTDGRGGVNMTKVYLNNAKLSFNYSTFSVKDYCKGKDYFTFYINVDPRQFQGMRVKLVRAPQGYIPPSEHAMKVGETYEIKQDYSYIDYAGQKAKMGFMPFWKDQPQTIPVPKLFEYYADWTEESSGEYEFEFMDECGRKFPFVVSIEKPNLEHLITKADNFKPLVEKNGCGRVRIYPFKNGYDLLINSITNKVYPNPILQLVGYPSILKSGDFRTNVPSQFFQNNNYILCVNNKEKIPADQIYLDVPLMNADLTFRAIPVYENYLQPQYKECFNTPLKVSLSNLALTFNHDTYSSYSCVDKLRGYIHIAPINNVGPVTMQLFVPGSKVPLDTHTGVTSESGTDFDLSKYLDQTGGQVLGTYAMIITDEKCGNYSNETLVVYNLGQNNLIGSTPRKMNFCIGESVDLTCANFGKDMIYTWYLPKQKGDSENRVMHGRKIHLGDMQQNMSGKYEIIVTGMKDCTGNNNRYQHFFEISVAPDELWWYQPEDANWNNFNNWYDKDGKPANAIPAKCTNVHIPAHPGGISGHDIFPDLSSKITKQDGFSFPECNDIYFHYGSKLGNPQNLIYHHAYVDYNFGIVDESLNEVSYKEENLHYPEANGVIMNRNEWYMLSAPLQNMYAADFSMAGYPMTYNRYVKSSTKSDVPDDVSFSASVPTLSSKYSYTQYDHGKAINALAMKVDGYKSSGVYSAGNQKNLNTIHGIFRIPYFEDANRMRAYPLESYNEASGESQVFYFNKETLKVMNKSERISRTEDAYRFVFESELENGVKGVGTVFVNGASVQGYSVSTEKVNVGEWFMVGNPFMGPISFDQLYAANKDNIEPYYYIYRNRSWQRYGVNSKPASTMGDVIDPVQSFLVKKRGGSSVIFPTLGSLSVLVSPNNVESEVLTSRAIPAGTTNPIKITAQNKWGSTMAMLSWESEFQSMPALSNAEDTNIPIVYIMDPKTKSKNVFEVSPKSYPGFYIGVYTDLIGPVQLNFDNLDATQYERMILEDRQTGVKQDLLSNPTYRFVNEQGSSRKRFYLHVKRVGVDNGEDEMEEEQGSTIQIGVQKQQLKVESSNSPLISIEIFDMQGQRVKSHIFQQARLYDSVEMLETGAYIIKVRLRDGSGCTKKILIE